MTVFAFHGKLNEEFVDLETGTWSKDITKVQDGRFTFKDDDAELRIGDTLHYWLYVIKDKVGYRREKGTFVVTKYTFNDILRK